MQETAERAGVLMAGDRGRGYLPYVLGFAAVSDALSIAGGRDSRKGGQLCSAE